MITIEETIGWAKIEINRNNSDLPHNQYWAYIVDYIAAAVELNSGKIEFTAEEDNKAELLFTDSNNTYGICVQKEDDKIYLSIGDIGWGREHYIEIDNPL